MDVANSARERFRLEPAILVGLCDVIGIIGYLTPAGPAPFQALGLIGKFILLLFMARRLHLSVLSQTALFPVLVLAVVVISFVLTPYQSDAGITSNLLFVLSLVLTLALVSGDQMGRYLHTIGLVAGAMGVLYLAYVATGRVESHFGRYYYFLGYHPNLGSEIAAVAVVVLGMTASRLVFGVLGIASVADILLMQGRAGLICAVGVILIRGCLEIWPWVQRNRSTALILLIVFGPLFLYFAYPYVQSAARAALMLDDQYRGSGSGFVGREERWNNAIRLFLDRPLTGAGPLGGTLLGMESPHNFYLYGISQYGLMFVPVMLVLILYAIRAARLHPRAMLVASPMLVLTVFNDRLFALNIYPFLLFVIIVGLSAAPSQAARPAPRRSEWDEDEMSDHHRAIAAISLGR